MNAPISVRRALAEDLPHIISFNQAMAWETENKHLPEDTIRPGVENLFQAPNYGFYLVAANSEEVTGSLMITFEWSDWRNGLIWWIQSVYVKPEWRRRGIYRQLYQHVKTLAEQDGSVRGFRLYVEKENEIAQETYFELGMVDSGYKLFEEMVNNA